MLKILDGIRSFTDNDLAAQTLLHTSRKVEERGRIFIYFEEGSAAATSIFDLFVQKRIPFIPISLTKFPERQTEMEKLTGGIKSTPQVFFNAKHIGVREQKAFWQFLTSIHRAWLLSPE